MKRMKYIGILAAVSIAAASMIAGSTGTVVLAEETKVLVAQANEMSAIEEVVESWMVPVYPEELVDGQYEIEVESSSAMFHIEECILTVAEGQMTAQMIMSGKGYLYVYMGTGAEAVQSSEEEYISFKVAEDGRHIYEIPVEALDSGISCTAFSKKREKWYDRTLAFMSASLPPEAFKNIEITTLESLNLENGSYTVEVSLEGSGRAVVASPADLYVEDGLVMAEIVFGSSNYDYVIAGDKKCFLLNEERNSAFLIPVMGFDYNYPIVANSIALGKPREISYTIRFDSSTITKIES